MKRISPELMGMKFSSYHKNLDMMKLLVSHKPFQKMVKEARRYLEIPEEGFTKKNSEKNKGWGDRLLERSDAMMDSPEFRRELQTIEQDRKNKKISGREARKRNEMLCFKIPLNYLHDMPRFIAAKFNVPEHFAMHIEWYIGNNSVTAPTSNFRGGALPPWKKWSDVRYLPVNIFAQLTDQDLQELKRYVAVWAKHLPKYKSVKNIDDKLTIEEWIENDRSHWDHAENDERGGYFRTTLDEFAKTAVDDGLLKGKSDGKQIYEIGRLMRDLRERRFGNK